MVCRCVFKCVSRLDWCVSLFRDIQMCFGCWFIHELVIVIGSSRVSSRLCSLVKEYISFIYELMFTTNKSRTTMDVRYQNKPRSF